jgi:acyl dehydratase
MTINTDIIGKKLEPISFTYNPDSVMLYALGIGAGVDELDFVYEKNLKVLPSFATVPFLPALLSIIAAAKLNPVKVVHGEQKILLHKPISTSGTFSTTAICTSIYDKGDSGAMANFVFETRDENGTLVFENQAVIVDRSGGNFGGDGGPKKEKVLPPEGKAPDFKISYKTSADQAAIYRLNGDKNPLHIEPAFARKAGFDTPILHGLCSYGFAARAIVNGLCGGDPSRLISFGARFMNVVYPQDTLTTSGWKMGNGRYAIVTTDQNGKIILSNGEAVIKA